MDNQQRPNEGYTLVPEEKPRKKKRGLWFFILAAVLVTVTGGFLYIGYNNKEYLKTDTINIGQTSEITIEAGADVILVPTNGDQLKVYVSGSATFTPDYEVRNNGRNIAIIFNRSPKIGATYFDLEMRIEVPKSYSGDFTVKVSSGRVDFGITGLQNVEIKSSSGSVAVSDIQCADLEINASSGKITLEDVDTDNLTVKASSGSINIESVLADRVEIKASSGTIAVDSLNAQKAELKASSGTVTVNEVIDTKLDITASSGKINVTYRDFGNNSDIDLNSSSGSITLALPDSAEFKIDAKTSSGGIKCEFETDSQNEKNNKLNGKTSENAKNTIKINASSGGVNIVKR